MTQADEISALREEVAELRKQVGSLIELSIQLARQAPYTVVPNVPPAPAPQPIPGTTPWAPGPGYPIITCQSGGSYTPPADLPKAITWNVQGGGIH